MLMDFVVNLTPIRTPNGATVMASNGAKFTNETSTSIGFLINNIHDFLMEIMN